MWLIETIHPFLPQSTVLNVEISRYLWSFSRNKLTSKVFLMNRILKHVRKCSAEDMRLARIWSSWSEFKNILLNVELYKRSTVLTEQNVSIKLTSMIGPDTHIFKVDNRVIEKPSLGENNDMIISNSKKVPPQQNPSLLTAQIGILMICLQSNYLWKKFR